MPAHNIALPMLITRNMDISLVLFSMELIIRALITRAGIVIIRISFPILAFWGKPISCNYEDTLFGVATIPVTFFTLTGIEIMFLNRANWSLTVGTTG